MSKKKKGKSGWFQKKPKPAPFRLGLPCYDVIQPDTVASIWPLAKMGAYFHPMIGTYIHHARNQVIKETVEPFILFVDADMSFTVKDLEKLMQAMAGNDRLGAVSGHYIKRDGSGLPVCNWKGADGEWMSNATKAQVALDCGDEIVEVGTFGAGFLLVRSEALSDMAFPWFDGGYNEDGGYVSEDTGFALKMQAAGWKTAVHFGAKVGHVGKTIFRPPDTLPSEEIVHAV